MSALPRRAAVMVLLACSALVPAGAAHAASKKPARIKNLWATINICDTVKHPDTIGIRASMPGRRGGASMYMRFQVEYFDNDKKQWQNLGPTADSGFKWVGFGRERAVVESGNSVQLNPPSAGGAYRLRGVVTFEWRRKGVVLRRIKKRTRSGHPTAGVTDPKGFSAAECTIKS